MMRIAVAGGGGLGYLIAEELANAGSAYNVVVLSTSARTFLNQEIELVNVNYDDFAGLCHALRGIDLVISTVTGEPQLTLIHAAGSSRVRHFVPSEFEGKMDKRPSGMDPLDHGSANARLLLRQYESSSRMRYTIFSCGVFMERFHPNGLSSFHVGSSSGVSGPGDYILDLSNTSAAIVERNLQGRSVKICMTSIYNVAQFVAAAVELGSEDWPREFTMCGDRMSLTDLVGTCSREFGVPFTLQRIQAQNLPAQIAHAASLGDIRSVAWFQRLVETTNGRYDFRHATLNDRVNVQPLDFANWLRNIYQRV